MMMMEYVTSALPEGFREDVYKHSYIACWMSQKGFVSEFDYFYSDKRTN